MRFGPEKVPKPEISERLSEVPWEITKEVDGLLCFKRGDVGCLVYERKY